MDVATCKKPWSPFEMTADDIKEIFFPSRPRTHKKVDVASLFAMVTNILNPATIVADNIFGVYVYVTTLHKLFIFIIIIL